MRVVAGRFKGRALKGPPKKSDAVRPTSDRARETLFQVLGDVSDLSVLDLFAGTGALAIEAISRGADSAVLVDKAPALAERNVEELGIAARCEIVRSDAVRFLAAAAERGDRYGLILCDPPYKLAARLAPQLAEHLPRLLPRYGRLVVESSTREPLDLALPDKIALVDERDVGEALIRIYRR